MKSRNGNLRSHETTGVLKSTGEFFEAKGNYDASFLFFQSQACCHEPFISAPIFDKPTFGPFFKKPVESLQFCSLKRYDRTDKMLGKRATCCYSIRTLSTAFESVLLL